jgi:hypothetical protein
MSLVRETSVLVLFGRAFWIMFGPLSLVASGLMIWFNVGSGWRTGADIVYLASLAGMILGRWLEFQGGNPRKSTGEPATPGDFRCFSLWVALGGVGAWIFANVVSNHLLPH